MGKITIDYTIQFDMPNDKLRTQVIDYANELNDAPAIIPAQDFLDFFKRDMFTNSDQIEFSTLTDEQKTCICMIYTSGLYTHLISILSSPILKTAHRAKSGDYINQQYSERGFTYTARIKNSDEPDEPELEDFIEDDNLIKEPIVYERLISSYFITPPLRVVFDYLIHIKLSFYLILEWFYNYLEHIEQLSFDYKTYNSLYESIAKEDYDLFYSIVNNYDNKTIRKLSIIIDLFYPTLHHFESQTTDYSHIIDNIRKNSHNLVYGVELTSSPIHTLFNFLIIYIFRNCIEPYLSDTSRFLHYLALVDYSKKFVNIFNEWIEKETEEILDYFRNHYDTIIDSKKKQPKDPHKILSEYSDDDNDLEEVDSKLHLTVGHDVEAIKKLATYLVNGFTNTRGTLPVLVSSNDEKNITINKLIFLFTGNKDYSFDGQYSLTWNAEQVYLKLLIKLLHNLNELATASNAVDKERSDYISDEYIKCNLSGGVWPKVAEAFENIKSAATIRNANYKKNYKDITAPINQKRQRDMKLIADMWLKCKDDIDF